jgi:hypothetical protein
MATKREYLAGLNPPLAKLGRGKFSKEAHEALAAAEAAGVTFDEPSYKIAKVKEVATEGAEAPSQLPRPVRAVERAYQISPQKRVRQVKCMYGEDSSGHVIGFALCQRCTYHVSLCSCKSGPKPPSVVVKTLDRFDAL